MGDDTGLNFRPYTGKGQMSEEEADALNIPKARAEITRGEWVERRLDAPPGPHRQYKEGPCPSCGEAKVCRSVIPCPDGIPGCAVEHYGYICDNCGAILQRQENGGGE